MLEGRDRLRRWGSWIGESWTGLLNGTEDSIELLDGRELDRAAGRVQAEELLVDRKEREMS